MRVLDLFCGAGGAAMGYHRAGFEVVGVDINPQPNYPFEFHQADAMTFPLDGFDAIHASPPCQAYSVVTPDKAKHPDLYAPTRDRLIASGKPWVIENVIGAPYDSGVVLCGSMFDLTADDEWIQRHRNFESSFWMPQLPHRHRKDRRAITVAGHCFVKGIWERKHSRQGSFALACRLMGIDWMTRKELVQSIPPAYTEWVGRWLMSDMGVERAA